MKEKMPASEGANRTFSIVSILTFIRISYPNIKSGSTPTSKANINALNYHNGLILSLYI